MSFQANAGQRMGVIGANGSGKTSLFALLLGELEADEGELGLDRNDVFSSCRTGKPQHCKVPPWTM